MVDGVPVARVSCGIPPEVTTVTGSLKVTVTGTTCPALYEPSARVDVTPETVGAVLSTVNVAFVADALAFNATSVPAIVTVAVPLPVPTV